MVPDARIVASIFTLFIMESAMNVTALEELRRHFLKLESRIDEMLLTQKAMLSFDEALRYLNLSASYLYKLTASRVIAHFKPGGKLVYFRRADLDEWMQTGKCNSSSKLRTQALNLLDKKSTNLKNGSNGND